MCSLAQSLFQTQSQLPLLSQDRRTTRIRFLSRLRWPQFARSQQQFRFHPRRHFRLLLYRLILLLLHRLYRRFGFWWQSNHSVGMLFVGFLRCIGSFMVNLEAIKPLRQDDQITNEELYFPNPYM